MKVITILALVIGSLMFVGCGSTETPAETTAAPAATDGAAAPAPANADKKAAGGGIPKPTSSGLDPNG